MVEDNEDTGYSKDGIIVRTYLDQVTGQVDTHYKLRKSYVMQLIRLTTNKSEYRVIRHNIQKRYPVAASHWRCSFLEDAHLNSYPSNMEESSPDAPITSDKLRIRHETCEHIAKALNHDQLKYIKKITPDVAKYTSRAITRSKHWCKFWVSLAFIFCTAFVPGIFYSNVNASLASIGAYLMSQLSTLDSVTTIDRAVVDVVFLVFLWK